MGGAVASKAMAKRANVYKEVVLEDVIRKSRGTKAQQMQAAEGLLMMSQQDGTTCAAMHRGYIPSRPGRHAPSPTCPPPTNHRMPQICLATWTVADCSV